ncbi:hypothetical protein F0562_009789 [Nyssa sinensis]|uniref:DUF7750 domain-containing protein n=1 Tax=Nyssa sinensis TaxID=561372 RepID=A0A5J4ZZX1_9ASTE|nr:hypothetical protein F0562_009789 [Nyssa sinensis]
MRLYRVWRRGRLKTNRTFEVRNQLGPLQFENLFENLISQFPSVNSLDLIAPVLGFASGVALNFSRFKLNHNSEISDIGEWILFTSPTPFNRFVMLRCPSISFEGSELLEDVNEKLVKEDRHYVRLNSGRIQVRDSDGRESLLEEKLVYQRECVSTDDGGVISLDWPANLDLTEERGLDATLLLVPGTAEGSMDRNIRSFVCECLKHGCFPVVMNPRGCAGSPLTTARLFTAADSDDICTAIQFINRARPWTTLMGVGWGYGANMLTKYLAEVGEKTPLTAATCIDNPFDLEEATRSSPHHIAVDQKLTGGLIDILQSNKELFQGRAKSTQSVVGNVKIPVLFIQTDDGTVPLFSIPHSLIAENPFTSLLLCSCLPSRVIATGRSTVSWCQHLTIEWLAAVELGLLKGHHPLLKDIDVNINPSTGLALVEGRTSNKSRTVNKLPNLARLDALKGDSTNSLKETLEESDVADSVNSRSRRDLWRNFELEDRVQQENNSALQQTSSADAELVKEGVNPVHSERGQVLQTTQVVMNMLDVTIPDSLTEEQKKKVLTAVGQGETLMKALQDAVPEDVRGKLTTAVSEILHNQGTNLKFDGLLSIGQIPNVASGLKSKSQEKIGLSTAEGGNEDPHLSDQRKRINDMADGSNNNQASTDRPAGELESEPQVSENLQQSIDTVFSREKATQSSEYGENGSETGAEPHSPSRSDSSGDTEDLIIDRHKVEQDGGMAQLNMKEESAIQQNEEKITDSSSEQNRMISSAKAEEGLSPPISSSDTQIMEGEASDNQKREEKGMQLVPNQNSPDPPTFSVSQALDALTGMDDSTQVAVNSVFGVIEDMITQLEEGKDNEEIKDRNEINDQKTGSVSENHHVIDDHKLEKEEDNKNGMSLPSDMLDDHPLYDRMDSQNHARARWVEGKPVQHPISLGGNSIDISQETDTDGHISEENEKNEHLGGRILLEENSTKIRCLNDLPLNITPNPYGDSLYNEYLREYLISKMKNTKSLDLDTTTTLLLDYIPEEGQWKLLEKPGNTKDSIGDVATHEIVDRKVQAHSTSKENYADKIIEPSYVILDTVKHKETVGESETVDQKNQKVDVCDDTSEESVCFVKEIILDSLKVEIGRRLTAADMKELETNLARDLEHVESALSLALGQGKDHVLFLEGKDCNSEKVGTLGGEHIIRAISFAVQDTSYLRRVLPVGIIVGSSLAALRKFFIVAAVNGNGQHEAAILDQVNNSGERNLVQVGETETDQMYSYNIDHNYGLDNSMSRDGEKTESKNLNNGTVMVGAVTAALGASALLVHQKDSCQGNGTAGSLPKSFKEREIIRSLRSLRRNCPRKARII